MKVILSILILTTFAEGRTFKNSYYGTEKFENEQSWEELCKNQKLGKRISHPYTCSKFITCIGYGVAQNCPAKLHFNADEEVCDYPQRAGCDKNYPPRPTRPPRPPLPPTGPTKPTEEPPSPWEKYCRNQKLGKRINHPDTCTKFITCIGYGVVQDCPPQLHFNADEEICDYPQRAGCDKNYPPRPTRPPRPPLPPTGPTKPTEEPPSPWEKYCRNQKLGKRVNHPDTCTKFITCIGSGVVQDCPPKLHFNADEEVCDYPQRAGCDNNYPPRPTRPPRPPLPPTGPTKPTEEPPSPWEKYCRNQKLGKRVNHPDTCTKFITCLGYGVVQNCPAKTHFRADKEVCDYPERAGCDRNTKQSLFRITY